MTWGCAPFVRNIGEINKYLQKETSYLKKKKDEITIRSSAAEYLTYVASIGGQQDSIEMRYEDENIWLTQKMMATLYDVGSPTRFNYPEFPDSSNRRFPSGDS